MRRVNVAFVIGLGLIALLLGGAYSCVFSSDAFAAEKFPEKLLALIVPYGMGSGDTEARTFARIMEKHLGKTIVPSNHEGGSGALGMGYLLRQPADGYSMGFMSATVAYQMASGKFPHTSADIQPLGSFNADYLCFAVGKDSPFKTLGELIDRAKSKPGSLNFGGTNVQGAHHIFALVFLKDAQIEAQYIPYNGANQTLVALLGKNIDVMVTSPSTVRQHVQTGEVRILAVSTAERVKEFPEVPSLKEMGFESVGEFLNFRGYFVKPGVSEETLKVLDEAFEKAVKDPEYLEYLRKEQLISFYKNRTDFTNYFNDFVKKAQDTLSGIKQ